MAEDQIDIEINRRIEQAVHAEREECAKIAEDYPKKTRPEKPGIISESERAEMFTAHNIAVQIRARK